MGELNNCQLATLMLIPAVVWLVRAWRQSMNAHIATLRELRNLAEDARRHDTDVDNADQ